MSSIPSINANALNAARATDRPAVIGRIGVEPETLGATKSVDSVEISPEALAAAATADDARAQRLARIKSQIQAGTYDEESKLVFAADRIARGLRQG